MEVSDDQRPLGDDGARLVGRGFVLDGYHGPQQRNTVRATGDGQDDGQVLPILTGPRGRQFSNKGMDLHEAVFG